MITIFELGEKDIKKVSDGEFEYELVRESSEVGKTPETEPGKDDGVPIVNIALYKKVGSDSDQLYTISLDNQSMIPVE